MSQLTCQILLDVILLTAAAYGLPHFIKDLKEMTK